MRDYKLIQMEQKDEENVLYNEWINKNEDLIIETYIQSLTIDDIPDEFISGMYEKYLESGQDE